MVVRLGFSPAVVLCSLQVLVYRVMRFERTSVRGGGRKAFVPAVTGLYTGKFKLLLSHNECSKLPVDVWLIEYAARV